MINADKSKNVRKFPSLWSLIPIFLVANLVLFGILSVNASSSLITSGRLYGGALDDEAVAIVNTDDEGYMIAGITYSFGAGSADF